MAICDLVDELQNNVKLLYIPKNRFNNIEICKLLLDKIQYYEIERRI